MINTSAAIILTRSDYSATGFVLRDNVVYIILCDHNGMYEEKVDHNSNCAQREVLTEYFKIDTIYAHVDVITDGKLITPRGHWYSRVFGEHEATEITRLASELRCLDKCLAAWDEDDDGDTIIIQG